MSFMKQDIKKSKHSNLCKGFTLLELLVAITIFSIAIAMVSYSFKYSLNIVKYVNFSYAKDLRNFSKFRDSIDSLYFFMKQKENNILGPWDAFKFLFEGNEKQFTYVSAKPVIFKKRDIVLVRVKFDDNKLILQEYPIYDKNVDYKNPTFDWVNPPSVVILDGIKDIKITYIKDGVEKFSLKNNIPDAIKITIRYKNRKEETLFFKIKSNAYYKSIIGENVYERI